MAFASLKSVLSGWSKKRKVFRNKSEKNSQGADESFFMAGNEYRILEAVNEYLRMQEKRSLDLIRAVSFRQGVLIFECQKEAMISELPLKNEKIFRAYLKKKIPQAKVVKISFRFI